MTAVDDDLDAAFDSEAPTPRYSPANPHPASPLAGLAAKREQARADLHLDLAVPDYLEKLGVDLYVRYRPIPLATAARVVEQARKSKSPDRAANANAAALAAACIGLYYVHEGRELAFVDGADDTTPWPTFDENVAAVLGVPWTTPTRLVRELFFTDDQVSAVVTKLQEWSEGELRERAGDDSGN